MEAIHLIKFPHEKSICEQNVDFSTEKVDSDRICVASYPPKFVQLYRLANSAACGVWRVACGVYRGYKVADYNHVSGFLTAERPGLGDPE